MGALLSFLFPKKEDPKTPIKGCCPRIKNIAVRNFRGILSVLFALSCLPWQLEKNVHHVTVQVMWELMAIFFLLQPFSVPVTGFIPIFILPMCGCMNSAVTCVCYFNENLMLFVLGGMILLMLNNSGVDRRAILGILSSDKDSSFSPANLVIKSSLAAFLLSAFSNRLHVTSALIKIMAPTLMNLQTATIKNRKTEVDYDKLRYVVCNAIHTSSTIGSLVFLHTAVTTLTFKAIFDEDTREDLYKGPKDKVFEEKFPFLLYSAFALPVALTMFLVNLVYSMIRLKLAVKNKMSSKSLIEMRKAIIEHKSELPPSMTCHEKLTIFFAIIILATLLTRNSGHWEFGWAPLLELERVQDASVLALFLIILHILPKGVGFFKLFVAKKISSLKSIKPESAILFWRYIDKNTHYGYIFVIGSGIALNKAATRTGLSQILGENFGSHITEHGWIVTVVVITLAAVLLANIMSGVAACAILTPFAISVCKYANHEHGPELLQKLHLISLAVGLGTTLSFCAPFIHTPAYFTHHTGRVPIRHIISFGIGSVVLCLPILIVAVCFLSEPIFATYTTNEWWTGVTEVEQSTESSSVKSVI